MTQPLVFPDIDPILVHLGPLAIRWYALAYITGLLLAWFGIVWALRRGRLWAGAPFNGKRPATEDQIGDLLVWATFGVILGGRLGWDLIYGTVLCSVSPYAGFCRGYPQAFLDNPIKIIAAWEGGMSFHGGLAGVVLAVWLFCRRQKLKLLPVADLVCAFAPMGLFFGRLANFVNGELWGAPTTVPWAIRFVESAYGQTVLGPPRHPSQLYEAGLEGLVLFGILWFLFWRTQARYQPGKLVGAFIFFYGIFRFGIEFIREPDAQLTAFAQATGLHMGQWLTVPMILGGLYLMVTAKGRRERIEPTAGTASVA